MSTSKIQRALISVSDKTNLIPLVRVLNKYGVEILSTGGTLKSIREAGVEAMAVDQFTGFPEVFEGRVKTLHPKIHGGLLYRRDKKSHQEQAEKIGVRPIDLVVVNLYPFEKVTAQPNVEFETAIENIDIGGPSMLRSAAKNYEAVTVVCDPEDYEELMRELEVQKGQTSLPFRERLALKVFQKTSAYDRCISDFLCSKLSKTSSNSAAPSMVEGLPDKLQPVYVKAADLRYGENPHQRAAFYVREDGGSRLHYKQLHGKELSFNNLLDIEATIDVMREFDQPAASVIKHNNPCGVAEAESITTALSDAIECDMMSAFGGIIGINRACSLEIAKTAFEKLNFFEVLIAPSFEPDALSYLRERKNLRLIETGDLGEGGPYDLRFLKSGVLLQDRDKPIRLHKDELIKKLQFPTLKKVSKNELEDLLFAFKCVKVVKSNAIVLTQGRKTVGIGAGQMSRVDSVDIACRKAGRKVEGAYLASDAFFPMPDSIEIAAKNKIRAIIQPGGSIRDQDVIAECDKFGIAMVLTGERHFRH